MLTCMSPELQKRFELQSVRDMIKAMDALYKLNGRSERYEITKIMIECNMAEGSSVGEHVITLAGYAERLKALEFPIPPKLASNMILASLPRLMTALS